MGGLDLGPLEEEDEGEQPRPEALGDGKGWGSLRWAIHPEPTSGGGGCLGDDWVEG